MSKFWHFIYSFALVGTTALLSAYFVHIGIIGFYNQIDLPPLTPPNGVFAPVWSILYILMIFSYFDILNHKEHCAIQHAGKLFFEQLILHILWCYLFFYSAWFWGAFFCILALCLTVWLMIKQFTLISPRAAYLQYPYLAWLCFAAYINGGVAYLNGGIYF